MSTTTLTANFSLTGSGSIFRDDFVGTVSEATAIGSGLVPSLTRALDYGTTLNKATKWYRASHNIAANATLSLDLTGNLIDPFGNTITFATIRAICIVNLSPARTINVGPLGVANAFFGPLKGCPQGYYEFRDWHHWVASVEYPITAGSNDVYPIKNNDEISPSGLSANVFVWILGT